MNGFLKNIDSIDKTLTEEINKIAFLQKARNRYYLLSRYWDTFHVTLEIKEMKRMSKY